MLELVTLCVFSIILLLCIAFGYSILYSLILGYILFCIYGLMKKFTVVQLLEMSRKGIKTVKNILLTFLLIGMMTAVWRACGTIPFIIYHLSALIVPSVFALIAFLLCCLISTLTGTSFGTAATVGVICMTFANAMGINPVFIGGAILSGIFFGDRCSPMSTSALLVSELTGTNIYRNVKNMVRTSIVPFTVSCILYLLGGMGSGNTDVPIEIWRLFADSFNLRGVVVLPAVLIIVLCALRINVKIAMAVSIITGSILCLLVQDTGILLLFKILIMGFQSPNRQLAAMMNGGGILSMVRVAAIVCISSSYAGIFEGTGLLNEIKKCIIWLSGKITASGSMLITSIITSMVACNQTLSIMLSHYLYKDIIPDKERLAVNLENTAVVIAPLIPWSIACAVPLATIAAPSRCIFAAFYLYLLPVCNLFYSSNRAGVQMCANTNETHS